MNVRQQMQEKLKEMIIERGENISEYHQGIVLKNAYHHASTQTLSECWGSNLTYDLAYFGLKLIQGEQA